MKLWSESWTNGDRIPARHTQARPDGRGGCEPSDNLNPHLAWGEVPAGAGSLLLLALDFDMPLHAAPHRGSDAGPAGELPAEAERGEFVLWLLADLPPQAGSIAEGEFSRAAPPGCGPGPQRHGAWAGARHGRNDWGARAADASGGAAGGGWGYGGPWPAPSDALVHHVVFTLYALDLPRLPLDDGFDAAAARRAITGHVLGAATFSGTCTLNPRLLESGF